MMEKKLILYGAGMVGKQIGISLFFRKISIECFCDRDNEKCGKNFCGVPVRSLDEIKRIYPKGTYYILITMKRESIETVKQDFINRNIFETKDFYDENIDPFGIMSLLMSCSLWRGNVKQNTFLFQNKFRSLTSEREKAFIESLLKYYFHVGCYEEFPSDYERKDFSDHLYGRLENDRQNVIPWLDSIQRLDGAEILEIGCGTGTSTVALCEQGAKVTAIDVNKDSIEVAKARMKAYGLNSEILYMNAEDISDKLSGRNFDFVIFFASMEHMIFTERINSIRAAFKMIHTGGHVVLVEIPNRLWYMDSHTSLEPFYNWLPNDVAMEYAKFTSRKYFNQGFDSTNEKDALNFARQGRGVSYHEFEIALGGRENIKVESSMQSFQNASEDPFANPFKKLLQLAGPSDIHEGFYNEYLNISLRQA